MSKCSVRLSHLVCIFLLFEGGTGLVICINEFKRNLSDAQKQITETPRNDQRIAQGNPMEAREEEPRPEPKRLLN